MHPTYSSRVEVARFAMPSTTPTVVSLFIPNAWGLPVYQVICDKDTNNFSIIQIFFLSSLKILIGAKRIVSDDFYSGACRCSPCFHNLSDKSVSGVTIDGVAHPVLYVVILCSVTCHIVFVFVAKAGVEPA